MHYHCASFGTRPRFRVGFTSLVLPLIPSLFCLLLAVVPAAAQSHAIPMIGGTNISRAILGQNVYCQTDIQRALDMQIIRDSSMRGVAGGLWADTYDWRNLTGDYLGPQTTLDMLRESRDNNSEFFVIANCRGIGTGTGSSFAYTDKTTSTLASTAADWVRYTNVIAPNYRQGDTLSGRDLNIVNSLTWTTDKLLAPGEAATRKVKYWEIGNEPEVSYGVITGLTASKYRDNYKAMSTAMIAEDAEIKVGPCITTAQGAGGNAWLNAVLADQSCKVDFVAYHPYGPLYWLVHNNAGGVLDPYWLQVGLEYVKGQQVQRKQEVVNALTSAGRDPNTPLMLTEYNPSSWEGTYYYKLTRCQAHALGVAETVFTFAELGIQAAQYWDHPNYGSTKREMPGYKVYKQLQEYMGDVLLDSFSDGAFRLYTTKDSTSGRVVIWGINMSETNDTMLDISLPWLTGASSVRRMTLAALSGGNTSLAMSNADSEVIGWIETDLTGQFNLSSFPMMFENATLTALIIDTIPEPSGLASLFAGCMGLGIFIRRRR